MKWLKKTPFENFEFVAIDFETTGFDPGESRVIEVGIVRTNGQGQIIDEWSTLINPDSTYVGKTEIHGITSEMVASAPSFADVYGDIASRLVGAVPFAHQAPFDFGFLRTEMERIGMRASEPVRYLDTLQMARRLRLPGKLVDLTRTLGFHYNAHNALEDARAAAFVLHRMKSQAVQPVDLPALTMPTSVLPYLAPSNHQFRRQNAFTVAQPGYFAHYFTSALRPTDSSTHPSEARSAYTDLLARCLADGRISTREAHELATFAQSIGLTADELKAVHLEAVDSALETWLQDGRLSPTERAELQSLCHQLGLDNNFDEKQINDARQRVKVQQAVFAKQYIGKQVMFTGRGHFPALAREGFSRKFGIEYCKSINKAEVLVVGTAGLKSVTVDKAINRGIPIITESELWLGLGVPIPRDNW